jgi:hypothetical protein
LSMMMPRGRDAVDAAGVVDAPNAVLPSVMVATTRIAASHRERELYITHLLVGRGAT